MYKRQHYDHLGKRGDEIFNGANDNGSGTVAILGIAQAMACLLYTSDAADERSSVDLGGRRIIKKKNTEYLNVGSFIYKTNTTD